MMKIILIEIILIFILFIRELGLPKLLYEELYTNPTARKMIPVFGDILYMNFNILNNWLSMLLHLVCYNP